MCLHAHQRPHVPVHGASLSITHVARQEIAHRACGHCLLLLCLLLGKHFHLAFAAARRFHGSLDLRHGVVNFSLLRAELLTLLGSVVSQRVYSCCRLSQLVQATLHSKPILGLGPFAHGKSAKAPNPHLHLQNQDAKTPKRHGKQLRTFKKAILSVMLLRRSTKIATD
jgi:hypothetical protein